MWLDTGDATALDQIEVSSSWPTAKLLEQQDLVPMGLSDFSIAEARALLTTAEREQSALALDCSWLLGRVPE